MGRAVPRRSGRIIITALVYLNDFSDNNHVLLDSRIYSTSYLCVCVPDILIEMDLVVARGLYN